MELPTDLTVLWNHPEQYYPHHLWAQPTSGGRRISLGAPPAFLGQQQVNGITIDNRWRYSAELFEPLWWYWHSVHFMEEDATGTTFEQLALDFLLRHQDQARP